MGLNLFLVVSGNEHVFDLQYLSINYCEQVVYANIDWAYDDEIIIKTESTAFNKKKKNTVMVGIPTIAYKIFCLILKFVFLDYSYFLLS